jgi:hypothetical protein
MMIIMYRAVPIVVIEISLCETGTILPISVLINHDQHRGSVKPDIIPCKSGGDAKASGGLISISRFDSAS